MSLGLKIGDDFLELPPESEMQMELNNPLLDFGNDMVGEFSYPMAAKLTPKNLKLLQGSGLFQKRELNPGIVAQAYDGTLQYSVGKLKIEKTQPNLNNHNGTGLNLIYLSGYSSFYQDIKDIKLSAIDVGGDRIFANDNFATNSNGFWSHIHQVMRGNAGYGTSGFDYAFYPVVNEDFGGSSQVDVMNFLRWDVANAKPVFDKVTTDGRWCNLIVPFPYLKYVLLKAVAHVGWRIEGDILNDPQFCKITMINSFCINWGWHAGTVTKMHAQVKFNLQNNLPSINISDFLLWLKNRLGWWYDFDKKKKLIRITQMKDSLNGEQKDLTRFTNPGAVEKTILTEKRIYKLVVGSSDRAVSFAGVNYKGQKNRLPDLPAAGEAIANDVYLVVDENNYYICQLNDAGAWAWELYTWNTGSMVPDNASETITTNAYIANETRFKFYNYIELAPQWDESGYWPGLQNDVDYEASVVLAFYYGLRPNHAGWVYPFASHHIYDTLGNQVGTWSLAFNAKKFDGTEVGLHELNWKPALDKLAVGEEVDIVLVDFPVEEWLNIKWNDELIIDGVKLYIKTMKPVLPYKNTLSLACIRL